MSWPSVPLSFEEVVELFNLREEVDSSLCMSTEAEIALFAGGRVDIMNWLLSSGDPCGWLVMPVQVLNDLFLHVPHDKLHTVVNLLAPNFDRNLRSVIRQAMTQIDDMDSPAYCLVRRLLSAPDMWIASVDMVLFDINKDLAIMNPQGRHTLLFGSSGPHEPSFFETVIPSALLSASSRIIIIQMIVSSVRIDIEYARQALLRNITHFSQGTVFHPIHDLVRTWVQRLEITNDVDTYTWLCRQVFPFASRMSFNSVYEMGLVDFIVVTEKIIPEMRLTTSPVSVTPSFGDLRYASNSLADATKLENVIRYCNWLVDTGRSLSLQPNMYTVLLKRLLYAPDSCTEDAQEAARRLVFSIKLMNSSALATVEEVYRLILGEFDESATLALCDIIGEAGFFMTPRGTALTQSLASRSPRVFNHVLTVSRLKKPTIGSILADILVLATVFEHDDARRGAIISLNDLVKETPDVGKYGLCILTNLLDPLGVQRLEGSRQSLASDLLFDGFIAKHVFGSEASAVIVQETCFLVLTCGPLELMNKFDERMRTEERLLTQYNSALNVTLDCYENATYTQEWRLIRMAEFAGDSLSLNLHRLSRSLKDEQASLAEIFLKRAMQSEANDIADAVLARALYHNTEGIQRALLNNPQAVGPLTLSQILKYFPVSQCDKNTYEKLIAYAIDHPEEYVEAVIISMRMQGPIVDLLQLPIPIASEIHFVNYELTLGSRRFCVIPCPVRQPLERIMLNPEAVKTVVKCTACQMELRNEIYKDDQDKFGIFYCKKCSLTRENAEPVMCLICKENDESLMIQVLSCLHVFCSACLERLTENGSKNCQMCFAAVAEMPQPMKAKDAIEQFLASR